MKKICFFGIYDSNYSRNKVLIKGFRENNFEVYECKVDPIKSGGITKFYKLYKQYEKIKDIKFNHVIVAFPGHSVVWLAYILFGRNIIFDAFVSLYNSNVQDRGKYGKFSFSSLKDIFLDWYSTHLAKTVLLDTNEHIKYFSNRYHLKTDKMIRVLVGTDTDTMKPIENIKNDKFILHFHGSFIPLQGIKYIVEAYSIILNKYRDNSIRLRIIGKGQELYNIKALCKKLGIYNEIDFIDYVPYEELVKYINNSDINLGIFGDGVKSNMVIPNKVYEAIACGKVVVTANTDAIKEIVSDNENAILVKSGDSEALAKVILDLKNNKNTIDRIEKNVIKLRNTISPKAIVYDFINKLQS